MDNKNFIDIDQNQLDKEWVNQPKLFLEWSTRLVHARADLEERKGTLAVMEAEKAADIRANPAKYGLDKVTETGIASAITLCPDVIDARAGFLDVKKDVDFLEAAVKALDHRKRALECLVTLFGQSYFSAPVARGAGREVADDIQKTRARRRARLNRNNEEGDNSDE